MQISKRTFLGMLASSTLASPAFARRRRYREAHAEVTVEPPPKPEPVPPLGKIDNLLDHLDPTDICHLRERTGPVFSGFANVRTFGDERGMAAAMQQLSRSDAQKIFEAALNRALGP